MGGGLSGSCIVAGFYRPYKGLKLLNFSVLFFFSTSFYRPYKGLKHSEKQNDTYNNNSFYRPYKGLKHKIN